MRVHFIRVIRALFVIRVVLGFLHKDPFALKNISGDTQKDGFECALGVGVNIIDRADN